MIVWCYKEDGNSRFLGILKLMNTYLLAYADNRLPLSPHNSLMLNILLNLKCPAIQILLKLTYPYFSYILSCS